jgi:glycosyltransferase involved in cell wall biosynthesis
LIAIPYAAAPRHLEVTSHAHIGLAFYSPVSLNNVFCAPNKVWEYAGFGLPILGNNIPGLEATIGKHGAGLCVPISEDAIAQALAEIDRRYSDMSRRATGMYDEVSVEDIVDRVIKGAST